VALRRASTSSPEHDGDPPPSGRRRPILGADGGQAVDRSPLPAGRLELHTRFRILHGSSSQALTTHLDDEGSKSRVDQAIAVLEAVNRIRAGGPHSQAAKNLPVELGKLGIAYPPVWSEAWDILRSRLVSCLAVLRDEVRRQTSLTGSVDE